MNSEISQLIRYLVGDIVGDIINLPQSQLSTGKVHLLRTVNFLEWI